MSMVDASKRGRRRGCALGFAVMAMLMLLFLFVHSFLGSLVRSSIAVLLPFDRSGFPNTSKKLCSEQSAPTLCKLTRSKVWTTPQFFQSCNGSSSALSRRESSESRCIGSLLCKSIVGASETCRWTPRRWARTPRYSSIL